jgi:putative ABC transport system ATP-binding protein
MTMMLTCDDLRKEYVTEAERVKALDGVSLRVAQGEFVAITGVSGSGKSTLLQLLGGLDKPSSGRITLDGIDYGGLTGKQLTHLRRRKIGFVFQSFNLLPTLTAEENVRLPLLLDGQREDRRRVAYWLAQVGLGDRGHHRPAQLSGGQQQRVAIARALASEPALVLADEPTGNLDSHTADAIVQLLRRSCDEFGRTVVMVTHDAKAAAYADRIITLSDGRIRDEVRLGGEANARNPIDRLAESL